LTGSSGAHHASRAPTQNNHVELARGSCHSSRTE
jgi:hypothetical protein